MIDPTYVFLAFIALGTIAGLLVARSGRGCLSLIVTGATYLATSATVGVIADQTFSSILLTTTLDEELKDLYGYGYNQLTQLSNLAFWFGFGLIILGVLGYLFFVAKERFGVMAYRRLKSPETARLADLEMTQQQTSEDGQPAGSKQDDWI